MDHLTLCRPPISFRPLLSELCHRRVVSLSLFGQERQFADIWCRQFYNHWTFLLDPCSVPRPARFGSEVVGITDQRSTSPRFLSACVAAPSLHYLFLWRNSEMFGNCLVER